MHLHRPHYNIRSKDGLIIFTRTPRICRVKTRMASLFNHRQCLYLHRQLFNDTCRRLNSRRYQTLIYSFGKRMLNSNKQVGHNLGQRMKHAMQKELKTHQRVVLIGCDTLVDRSVIEKAFSSLHKINQVVIGPANDGGYFLIGVHTRLPQELFYNIPWGQPTVLKDTLSRLGQRGLEAQVLAPEIDIDTADDWQQLAKQKSLPSWASALKNSASHALI